MADPTLLGYAGVIRHALVNTGLFRRASVRRTFVQQVYFTGVEALPFVAAMAIVFGAVVVARALAVVGTDNDAVLKNLVWVGVRELGPVAAAMVIIARSSVAIAAELGLMRLRGELPPHTYEGVAAEEEVILPRIAGVTIASVALTTYFQLFTIASALATMSISLGTPASGEFAHFVETASSGETLIILAKGAIFGVGIAAISCYHGLAIPPRVTALPKAVIAAGLGSLAYVGFVDAALFALRSA